MFDTKKLIDNYYKGFKKSSVLDYITLNQSHKIEEFQSYGNKISIILLEMIKNYEFFKFEESQMLEIGCGLGRLLLPMANYFDKIYGIDISEEIILECKKYFQLNNVKNYEVFVNNGYDLNMFQDNSLEYCFSSGVFQHVVDYASIDNYIKETMRILKINGIFLFQFQSIWEHETGKGRKGAKITAKKLNKTLLNKNYKILEINYDPYDPMRQFVIIIQKTKEPCVENDFSKFKVTKKLFRTKCIDFSQEESQSHEQWMNFLENPQDRKRITFFD